MFHNDDISFYPIHDSKKDSSISIFPHPYFEKIVSEFDTTSEFIDYLINRNHLLTSNNEVSLNGNELDLAAIYLTNARKFPKEFYNDVDHILLDINGEWDKYDSDEQTRLKRLANKSSYFIDWLVKEYILNNHTNSANTELAKVLLNLDRLMRRVVTNTLFELIDKYKTETEYIARRVFSIDDHYYSLIYVSDDLMNKELAEMLCETYIIGTHIYLAKKEPSKHIVLVTNRKIHPVYYSYGRIDEKMPASLLIEIEERCKSYGFLQKLESFQKHYSEYPGDT